MPFRMLGVRYDGWLTRSSVHPVTLAELIDLASAPTNEGRQVLTTLFEWRRERYLVLARGALTFAASLIVALGVAFLRGEVKTPLWVGIATLAGVLSVGGYGLLVLGRILPALSREYLFAARLFEALRQ